MINVENWTVKRLSASKRIWAVVALLAVTTEVNAQDAASSNMPSVVGGGSTGLLQWGGNEADDGQKEAPVESHTVDETTSDLDVPFPTNSISLKVIG